MQVGAQPRASLPQLAHACFLPCCSDSTGSAVTSGVVELELQIVLAFRLPTGLTL